MFHSGQFRHTTILWRSTKLWNLNICKKENCTKSLKYLPNRIKIQNYNYSAKFLAELIQKIGFAVILSWLPTCNLQQCLQAAFRK